MTSSDRQIAEIAADWIVRLTGDDADERAAAAAGFERWKRADPRHAAAAQKLERFVGRVQSLRETGARPARIALEAGSRPPRERLRRARIAVVPLLLLLGGTALALSATPPDVLFADIRTGTGAWETRVLEDGSRVTLNGASAVDLNFDPHQRELRLIRGEILVEVARDTARPFVVRTTHGRMEALGTRFIVSEMPHASVLTVLESKVRAEAAGGRPVTVAAGQRVSLAAGGAGTIESVDAQSLSDAWTRHQLVVQGMPLPEVLDILARHRRGYLRFDAAALAGYRVSAVLPLNDTDRALQLLLASFPIRVRTLTPWLTMVDPQP